MLRCQHDLRRWAGHTKAATGISFRSRHIHGYREGRGSKSEHLPADRDETPHTVLADAATFARGTGGTRRARLHVPPGAPSCTRRPHRRACIERSWRVPCQRSRRRRAP